MADRISILEVEYKRQCDENVRLVSELEDVNRLRTESLQQIKSKLNATEETLRDTEQVCNIVIELIELMFFSGSASEFQPPIPSYQLGIHRL